VKPAKLPSRTSSRRSTKGFRPVEITYVITVC